MLLGIDHLVIAVADPDAAVEALRAELGLEPGAGGRHDRLGTFNRLVWLGDAYLELIGVFDAELAAASWLGAPTVRALDAGGGLATWAVATDAIDFDVARFRDLGSYISAPILGERTRPDGRVVRWRLAAPPDLGPDRPPFLIEHDPTGAEWTPAERGERAGGPARLERLEIPVDEVDRTGRSFTRSLGVRFRPSLVGGGARETDIGPHHLRLRPRGAHPAAPSVSATIGLSIAGLEPTELELLGCRWVVRP
jgi:Glyoxalase-like domain